MYCSAVFTVAGFLSTYLFPPALIALNSYSLLGYTSSITIVPAGFLGTTISTSAAITMASFLAGGITSATYASIL